MHNRALALDLLQDHEQALALAGLVCEHDPGEADALIERARTVAAEIAAAELVIGYREKSSDG